MKHYFLLFLAVICMNHVIAQEEDDMRGKFRKENVFVGGSVNLGFGGDIFIIGGVPEIGYSINKWLDAGVAINLNYQTERVRDWSGAVFGRARAFNYGAGVFARVWPVRFLHIAVQPEYNFIRYSYIDDNSNQKFTETRQAESLLVGVGYGSRDVGRALSYITVMVDLAQNINSPYRDGFNRGRPILRTGFGFYLGRSRR